jgi:hypothetical protein
VRNLFLKVSWLYLSRSSGALESVIPGHKAGDRTFLFAVCCRLLLFRCGWKKKPFDGGKNFFRRGYIDLRMHEEGVRVD